MRTIYCRHSNNATPSATLSLTAGSANATFPLANVQDRHSRTVFKATGTSCTIRSTWAGNETLQGLCLFNHNLAGATVTISNPAGLSTSFTIPAQPEDGLCLDPWKSFVGLSNVVDDVWDIAITGASAAVAIGEIVWVRQWESLPFRWRSDESEGHPAIVLPTAAGRHTYALGLRTRGKRGDLNLEQHRAQILTLQRDSMGPHRPLALIPDDSVNDALWATLVDDARTYRRVETLVSEVTLSFVEQQKGLAL